MKLVEGENTVTGIVKEIEKKVSKNGKEYYSIFIEDKEGAVSATMWSSPSVAEGDVVIAKIISKNKSGTIYYNIENIKIDPNGNKYDFVKAASKIDDMIKNIIGMADNFKDKKMSLLVKNIFNENLEEIKKSAAGAKIHHDYIGGLLQHSLGVAVTANSIVKAIECQKKIGVCPYTAPINKDLVLTIAVLHDVGKIKELETSSMGKISYTDEGNLLGHSYIGAALIQEECKKIGLDKEITNLILNGILSHMGKPEWGQVIPPKTIEAMIVEQSDYIDSRCFIYGQTISEIPENETYGRRFGIDYKIRSSTLTKKEKEETEDEESLEFFS